MLAYNLDIDKNSTWMITTLNAAAKSMPFYLTEIGKFYANENYYTKRSGKEGFFLIYTHAGSGMMTMEESELELLPKTALLIECNQLHLYKTLSETPWVNFWLHLDGSGVQTYFLLLQQKKVALQQPDKFVQAFDELMEKANHIDVVSTAQISQGISSLLTDMLVSLLGADNPQNILHHSGIDQAVSFMKAHYKEQISINDMTKNINISKYHFVRLFCKHIGTTPYHYLIQYRVNQSKKLLCTTNDSISEIALQVGYASESNYINQFKRAIGMTPAQFRKSNINYFRPK